MHPSRGPIFLSARMGMGTLATQASLHADLLALGSFMDANGRKPAGSLIWIRYRGQRWGPQRRAGEKNGASFFSPASPVCCL